MRALVFSFLLGVALVGGAGAAAPVPAPDFTLATPEGRNVRLGEQRGQVVLLNFWASWCGPCRQEAPRLGPLAERYRQAGFVVLGVNIDDDPRKAAQTAARWGLTVPVLLDADKAVSRLYAVDSMPSSVLIDRDGRIRRRYRGYREGAEQAYEQDIRELLKE